ncbi:MAG: hypothetical protein KA105_04315 [Caulobacter sp.]|jgi:hypothetical protein|nr:hypothetical protein [Caulobacter sp.]
MAVERTIEHRDGTVERVTTTDAPAAAPVRERGGSGIGGIVALIIGLLAVVVVGYFLLNMSQSEAVKDNAIAGAAESVSGAAENIGDTAQKAGEAIPAPKQ